MSRKEKLWYPFYVMLHPFDGFYEIRHRGRGSVVLAILFVFLYGLSFSVNRRFAGFVVNLVNPLSVDTRLEVVGVFLAVLLFATANWSITCLMEGEGRWGDILTVIGYSMLPMILTYLPATLLSWFIASDEESIYYILMNISILYFVILLLVGIMTVHNFGFGKTLFTLLLTFLALILIIFVALLLISLINQVYLFLRSAYTELILRV